MAELDRIVKATILLRTAPVAERSFSDMLILATHNFTAKRVTSVNSDSELGEMGVGVDDPLRKAVMAAFSQEPGVSTVYIGRRLPGGASLTVTPPSGDAGEVYSVTLEYLDNGVVRQQPFSYITVGDATDDDATKVAALLAALIDANTAITAAASTDTITLTAASGVPAVVATSDLVSSTFTASTESITDAATAARQENDVFYGIGATTRVEAEQIELAQWAEANGKLAALGDGDLLNFPLLTELRNRNMFRTYVVVSASVGEGEYPEIALMSRKFREQPGSETWANATLGGVSHDNLPEAASKAIRDMNGNTFEPFRNLSLTQGGKVAGGEWIDVIRFRDWLLEQIRVNVFQAFVNNRIPFTDPGIAIIHGRLLQSLIRGRDVGGIAPEEVDPTTDRIIPSFTTTIPSSVTIPVNDKANRTLKGVKFTARLAGAIHAVEIDGTLAYEL